MSLANVSALENVIELKTELLEGWPSTPFAICPLLASAHKFGLILKKMELKFMALVIFPSQSGS